MYFNFKLSDGTAVTQSFAIVPVNFPTVSSSYTVNGEILTSSVAPATFNLNSNVFKVELNKGASNNWYISGSNNTASAAIVSGSYSTGSLCNVSFFNVDNGHNLSAGKTISIKPVKKNVGFNDSFILEDTVYHVTDATGSLVVSLVPQTYSVQYHGNFRTEPYSILIPSSASVNVKDCLVTSTNVAKIITPKNQADFAYTAQVSDARYLSNAIQVSSSISASHALVADSVLGSVQSASIAATASYVRNADSASFYGGSVTSASFSQTASAANSITFVPSSAVSSSFSQTASFAVTSSKAISSSYSDNTISASKAQSSSFATVAISASWAPIQTTTQVSVSSSFASASISSSFATTAGAINFVPSVALSASFASQSISASALVAANNYTVNNLTVPGTNQTSSQVRIGSLEFEAFNSLNNFLLMENMYYSGSFTYRNTGRGSVIQFVQDEIRIGAQPNGTANTTGSLLNGSARIQIKPNSNGTVGIGGNIDTSVGSFSGAGLVVSGTSSIFQVPLTASLISASLLGNASTATTASFAVTSSAANSITFTPLSATSASFTTTASFAQSSSFAARAISSSFSTNTITATQLENRGTGPASISTAGNNGFNINDADGSTMGITGGGISIVYNPLSAVPPFTVRNVNNATLSKIDGNGSFICVNSASVSGSLFGTASYARTASFVNGANVFGNVNSASLSQTASMARMLQAPSNEQIFFDSSQHVWICGAPLDLSVGGIYDGANGVVAATFSDVGHILNNINGLPVLDFSGPNQLLGDWSGSITLANTASIAGKLYDAINKVTAIDVQDQRILYDINGSQKLVFSAEPGLLIGQWSGLVSNSNTASFVSSSGIVTIQSAANNVQIRNSSSIQRLDIFTGFVNTSSFRQLSFYGQGNDCILEANASGSFTSSGDFIIRHAGNHSIKFWTSGSQKWTIGSNGDFLPASSTLNIGQAGQGVNNLYVTNIIGATGSLFGTASIAQAVVPNTWSTLSAGAAVTWSAANNVYDDKKMLTVTGATTMSIQGLYNGWEGSLKVTNGNTGSLLFISPIPKVINGATGSVMLTNISASVDMIGFEYDGTTLYAAVGNNFN